MQERFVGKPPPFYFIIKAGRGPARMDDPFFHLHDSNVHQYRLEHPALFLGRRGCERRRRSAQPDRATGRRSTLIAKRSERNGKAAYTFTINLQGPEETVFFDVSLSLPAMDLRAERTRRKASGSRIDAAEISGVVKAERIGDG
jgi:hypothetical protein